MRCTSCNRETSDGTKFKCPECKKEVFRCERCRSLSINYKCKCNYIGP